MLPVIVNYWENVTNNERLLYLGGSLILGQGPVTDEKGLSSHQVASNACTTNELYYSKVRQYKEVQLLTL